VVDGFGHVSVRHDKDAARFPPSQHGTGNGRAEDVMEFTLDGEAVDPRGRAVYLERFIHGEIYCARPTSSRWCTAIRPRSSCSA
jgi:HCOMODA/2-hydroxy-3-carboxy-muconic semialdehyde decarboxylase